HFVLRIEDGSGKHTFIGLGFAERKEAFGFNVELLDHEKHVRRENEEVGGESSGGFQDHTDIDPSVNHLKEGETIRINVKHKPSSGKGMLSAAGLSGGHSGTGKPKLLGLAPPPHATAGKIRSPLPPPPNDPVVVQIASPRRMAPKENTRQNDDSLSDFSLLEVS
ncbi:LOW QUALITY PROTEIN: DUF1681 domain-containing protein, partial [Cephalotus follicularis]